MTDTVDCLVVDDVEENRVALTALLEQENVRIHSACNGRDALELLLVHDFALALLDVQMPDMDGFELAELMRGSERTRQVPIIFVTAGANDRVRIFRGYDKGAVDFIFKPIDPHVLQNKAEVFFGLYRQRRQLARELHERTETLRLNEMFTALLAHDLRNPLSAIITSAQMLQRRPRDAQTDQVASRIVASGRRMARMIEDMLDLARTRLGSGLVLKRESTDLRGPLERVVREHQVANPERRIESAYVGQFEGLWDTGRLAQVASNLIGNALTHGEADEPVYVALDGNDGDVVRFSVTNSGHIPEETRRHLFNPFHTVPRTAQSREGLGLGLYIVQEIVKAHEGNVELQTGVDSVTVFEVQLPRRASNGGPELSSDVA